MESAYADDILSIESSSHAASESLNLWNAVLTEYRLKLNIGKTKIMVVSRREEILNMEINGVPIQQKESVKYLGVNRDGKPKHESAVEARVTVYSQNLGLLYPLLKDQNVPTAIEIAIYKSILRPILTYGCESWNLDQQQSPSRRNKGIETHQVCYEDPEEMDLLDTNRQATRWTTQKKMDNEY
ncbi:uncharacterized protein LOC143036731 [Oratosquilla oratoria]|uniref:uncharacterized protein LOC143036731 n=1 Tax=Oratosquilla oratoria TaxID=337810 RepID=UPI003F76E338